VYGDGVMGCGSSGTIRMVDVLVWVEEVDGRGMGIIVAFVAGGAFFLERRLSSSLNSLGMGGFMVYTVG